MDPELVVHSSDDEETLLMKENLLKIRLRKKKLAKQASTPAGSPERKQLLDRPVTPPPRPLSTLQNPFASPKSARHGSTSNIQVPSSPSPQKRRPLPISPARIILGIDKGRTGKDVSLRRTPEKPIKTFNQRLAEQKNHEQKQQDKTKDRAIARLSSFNPVPAFSSNTDALDKDGPTGINVVERKVSVEDCNKAASCVSKTFSIYSFFAHVCPPAYELSEEIKDFIVYGILSAKTEARTTANGAKYCVLTLTDLKTDVTMFLYDSAFEKYWTLALGSLCYFLNPIHQKPRVAGAGLSLKMTDDSGILEIGKSADFGICRSIKKNGTQCTAWINSKKQEVCDYHLDLSLAKSTNKRMEFASGTKPFDPRNPTRKRQKQQEDYAQHAVFFGDNVTTLRGEPGQDFEKPLLDTARLQREAQARQREREVLAKLMAHSSMSAGHEYFDTVDPNAQLGEQDDDDDDGSAQERVFSATVLRKLGFDPTKRKDNALSNSNCAEEVLSMQRDAKTVDLKVEMSKGSALFTKAGVEATAHAQGNRAQTDMVSAAEDDDSDLEIVK